MKIILVFYPFSLGIKYFQESQGCDSGSLLFSPKVMGFSLPSFRTNGLMISGFEGTIMYKDGLSEALEPLQWNLLKIALSFADLGQEPMLEIM